MGESGEQGRDLTERTRISLPVMVMVGMLCSAAGAGVSLGGVRPVALSDIQRTMQSIVAGERQDRREALRHYVTREEWLLWQRRQGAERDRQFATLLKEIRSLKPAR